jgi:hypothetical protein
MLRFTYYLNLYRPHEHSISIYSDIVNHFPFLVVDMMQVENLQDVARVYFKECVTFPESHSLLLLRYVQD